MAYIWNLSFNFFSLSNATTTNYLSITYYKSWILKIEDAHNDDMCHFLNAYNKDSSSFFFCFSCPLITFSQKN